MKIALPLADDGSFSLHFGGSSKVAIFEVDPTARSIGAAAEVVPPEPEPCGWADWLASQKVKVLLAGGMGRGAQVRLAERGIEVVVGVPPGEPHDLVRAWLENRLQAGPNSCEGGHHGHHHGHHGSHACECGG